MLIKDCCLALHCSLIPSPSTASAQKVLRSCISAGVLSSLRIRMNPTSYVFLTHPFDLPPDPSSSSASYPTPMSSISSHPPSVKSTDISWIVINAASDSPTFLITIHFGRGTAFLWEICCASISQPGATKAIAEDGYRVLGCSLCYVAFSHV